MKKKKFGLESQGYVAPKAESVEVETEGLLCASGGVTADSYDVVEEIITWGDGGGN